MEEKSKGFNKEAREKKQGKKTRENRYRERERNGQGFGRPLVCEMW